MKNLGKTTLASYDQVSDFVPRIKKMYKATLLFTKGCFVHALNIHPSRLSGVSANNNSHDLNIQHDKTDELPQQILAPVQRSFRRDRRISFVVICLDFIRNHRFFGFEVDIK